LFDSENLCPLKFFFGLPIREVGLSASDFAERFSLELARLVVIRIFNGGYERYNQPIQFVFEAGTEGQGQIDRMFRFLSRNDYFRRLCRVGGWSFQNKSVMPLQAADTAAYEFYKLIHGHVIERGIRGVRKSARDLFRQQELQYLRDWDRPNLERWAKEWLEQFRLAEVS
jgi:hypothetical protein